MDERSVWPASIMVGLEDVVGEVETDVALLITSGVTRAEVFTGKLTDIQREKFSNLMRRRGVQEITPIPSIMDRASAIREYHNARKKTVHTPDAIHLATAVIYRADEFQTMDGLQANGGKRGLLALSGDVGGYNLTVVHPYPRNSPIPEVITVKGPLFTSAQQPPASLAKPPVVDPAPPRKKPVKNRPPISN